MKRTAEDQEQEQEQEQHVEAPQLAPEGITISIWNAKEATRVVGVGGVTGIMPVASDSEQSDFAVVAHQSDKDEPVHAWLVPRYDVAAFLLCHTNALLVTHNASDTFFALLEACRAAGREDAAGALVALVDSGRFRDVAVLDALVMLAERGKKVIMRRLSNIAAEHLVPERAPREAARERLKRRSTSGQTRSARPCVPICAARRSGCCLCAPTQAWSR